MKVDSCELRYRMTFFFGSTSLAIWLRCVAAKIVIHIDIIPIGLAFPSKMRIQQPDMSGGDFACSATRPYLSRMSVLFSKQHLASGKPIVRPVTSVNDFRCYAVCIFCAEE